MKRRIAFKGILTAIASVCILPYTYSQNPDTLTQPAPGTEQGCFNHSGENARCVECDENCKENCGVCTRPEFRKGGINNFRAWVEKRLFYPSAATAQKIEGEVILGFNIGIDGTIQDITIIEAPHISLGLAAAQIVKQSPKWTPGTCCGKAVKYHFTLPVHYKLKRPETHKYKPAKKSHPGSK